MDNQSAWIASRNAKCGKSPPNRLYECLEKSERDRAVVFAAAIVEERAKAERERIAVEDAGYDPIQIDDFILDSKTLIASEKKIVIAGFYKTFSNIEELYPSAQAALASADNAGMIYVLSENADRNLPGLFSALRSKSIRSLPGAHSRLCQHMRFDARRSVSL